MKGASVLEPKKNAGRMARLGVLAALLIAAGILVWQNPLSAVPQPPQPEAAPELEFREDEEAAELAAAHELLTRPPCGTDDDALDLSIAHDFITNNHKGDDDDDY